MSEECLPPLLIVDVQNGFVNEHSEHVVPVIAELGSKWLAQGGPVFMSQFVNHKDSQWEKLIGWSRLESEDEIAIHPALRTIAGLAVTYRKDTYTCIVDPFREELMKSDWREVVVCGIATDSCVLATAIDLFQFRARDIRPIVVRDAVASQAGERVHNAGLMILRRFIGSDQLMSKEELFSEETGLSVNGRHRA